MSDTLKPDDPIELAAKGKQLNSKHINREIMTTTDAADKQETTYQAGTLTYNKRTLFKLFFWLILGDFAMSVMGVCVAKLLPLQLNEMGVPAGKIATILSLGPLASLTLSPFVGIWSDRLRTRWGRRRPFLLISTPILALGLVCIPHIKHLGLLSLVILIVQVCSVMETVIYYLYADVVPSKLMGRFMAGFRIVGVLGSLAFLHFFFPHFGEAPVWVWTVIAIGYLLCYQLSLHFVKEGTYPPPVLETKQQMARDYVKDGFTSRYIWLVWGAMGMTAFAAPALSFINIFSKNELGFSYEEIARLDFWATVPALFLMFPGGWLMDKIGPRILWALFSFLMGIALLATYFFVYEASSMRWFYLIAGIIGPLQGMALMPMLYAHLPSAKFGQLTSTQSLVVQSFIFVSGNVVGQIIEHNGNNYRIAFIYAAPFLLMVPVFVFLLSRAKWPFPGLTTALAAKSKTLPAEAAD